MLERSNPARAGHGGVSDQSEPRAVSFMHNLKHNKVVHERVVIMCVRAETTPRAPEAQRFEMQKLSADFYVVILHFGDMESPRVPHALRCCARRGEVRHHDDFVLSRPPHAKTLADFGHAAMAGRVVHRARQTGDVGDGLLFDPGRSRGRAGRR